MQQIKQAFQKNKILIPYICAGDPDLETTREINLYSGSKRGRNY